MKTSPAPPFAAILFGSAVLCLLSACSSPPAPIPPGSPLGLHLAPTWIAAATRLQAGEYTVYYRGTATAGAGSAPGKWQGTFTGDILLLSKTQSMLCPSGTVTFGPGVGLSIKGSHQIMVLSEGQPAPWQSLLPQ